MSKVPYTFVMDEYFCTTLEYLRKMHETRDYSQLLAVVERLQIHGNSMESALSSYWHLTYLLKKIDEDDPKLTDEKFRKRVRKLLKKLIAEDPFIAKKLSKEQDEDEDEDD